MIVRKRPQEVVEYLVRMRGIKTSRELAVELGVTRNAIIGAWNRAKSVPGYEPMEAYRFPRRNEVKPVLKPSDPIVILDGQPRFAEPKPAKVRPLPLVGLGLNKSMWTGAPLAVDTHCGGCRWPFGDPKHTDFHFCCEPVEIVGRPYCRVHRVEAWGGRPGRPAHWFKLNMRLQKEHAR